MKISNEKKKTFGVYCGQKTGHYVFVTGEVAVITFHSDYSFERRGFLISFTGIPIGKYNHNVTLFFIHVANKRSN